MKKEKLNYFEEFIKITEIIDQTTIKLKEILNNYNINTLKGDNEEIHKLENESDQIVHKVNNYLISDFLPPIEREDIILLLHKLDDVEDGLDEISKNFYILNIENLKEETIKEFINLLDEASKKIKDVFLNLSNKKNKKELLQNAIELNEIENKADIVFENVMKSLYENEKNATEIIKWTTIYNGFENIFDNYEEVARTIEDIIIKTL